jgi:hypothetical protein
MPEHLTDAGAVCFQTIRFVQYEPDAERVAQLTPVEAAA